MTRHTGVLTVLLVLAVTGAHAQVLGPPVDLLQGLEQNLIWAQFWGGGETGVNGVIGRAEGGPREVTVSPGTQFWSQTPGRQGMTGLGATTTDLSQRRFAQVWIPTACTNINLQAPTEDDVMVASASPSEDMVRLSRSLVLDFPPQPVVQVAVWAVANDPPFSRVRSYLWRESRQSEGTLTVDSIMQGAAALLQTAGLDAGEYRMYR